MIKLKGFERAQYNLEKRKNKQRAKCIEVKHDLLSEALTSMIERCMWDTPDENEKELLIGLTNNLIHENGGVIKSMSKYRTKSYALSEAVRIVNKYYTICEQAIGDTEDADLFTIDIDTKNKFYKELEKLDMEQAEEVIAKRVRNNTYDFIKNNTIANDRISDIIDATKNKIDELNANRSSESLKEQVLAEAASMKEQIINRLDINTNPFGIVVKNMAKNAYIDDKIKELATNEEGKIDFNLVDKYANTFYTFLEGANGLKMADINKDNIIKYMKTK